MTVLNDVGDCISVFSSKRGCYVYSTNAQATKFTIIMQ